MSAGSGQRLAGSDSNRGLRLDTPAMYLKGVGPVRAELLGRIGILTARDLLYHIPHRYEDATTVAEIATLHPGMEATVIGRVISKGILPTRKRLRIFQVVVKDASGMIEASWPGQPYLDRSIERDDVLLLSGPVRFYHGRQLQPKEWVNLGPEGEATAGRVLSVYSATEGVSFKHIRSIVERNIDALLPLVREPLPAELLEEAGVPPLDQAMRMVHKPTSVAEAHQGRSRLAFEELLGVHLLHRRANALAREPRKGITFTNRKQLTTALRKALPFELTGAQVRAIREIVADMCSGRRMHRMLQGDVGAGKTVVALFAALLAMENGYQAAIMAPTELLAEQHLRTITRLLEPLGIKPLLLTGSLPAAERRRVQQILTGSGQRAAGSESPGLFPAQDSEDVPALVVGTHALVQEGTTFANLGFAAIDEQHRFGVEQRAALREKGGSPDVLLMSATPIPRSLALTMYGDLDLTVLDERPPGRQPITTVMRKEKERLRMLQFVDKQVELGRQAYIVYPVIEESERTDLKAAETMYQRLSEGAFAERRVALLHGRIPSAEREDIMRRFRDGQIDILVATTVIEVGIDVANATVMLIEHPERFGLSQLHQLRGRVGRGAEQSYCILLGDVSPDTAERLKVFVDTEDGFEIARADLMFRGMGDLFGREQSGEPTFKVADPIRDEALGERARIIAERLLAEDPELSHPSHTALRQALGERFKRAIELFRVG